MSHINFALFSQEEFISLPGKDIANEVYKLNASFSLTQEFLLSK